MTAAPRVVVVGAGFGGLAAARSLAKAGAEVTLVDRQHYHLFQPNDLDDAVSLRSHVLRCFEAADADPRLVDQAG
ncbi:MAG: FAD-dependent oxidoreductase [Egibacteraceae bacterium]